MAKWILWLSLLIGIMSCQSKVTNNSPDVLLPPESGTVAPTPRATVPLIFFLKEVDVLNSGGQMSVRDTALFRSLPTGVYKIHSDTIIFRAPPTQWISSGITRWPASGRVALADFIISDNPLFSPKIGIFPQKPGEDGYLPGCFSCPEWMVRKHGALVIFWDQFLKK